MNNMDKIIVRKALKRAFVIGVATGFIVLFPSLSIFPLFNFPDKRYWFELVFLPTITNSVIFSGLGGMAGYLAASRPTVASGVLLSGSYCSIFGLGAMGFAHNFEYHIALLIYLLCFCACAMVGVICGGVGAVFGRTCREFEGKRFWPQFTVAELMALVLFVAIFMSCIFSLRQILGKPP